MQIFKLFIGILFIIVSGYLFMVCLFREKLDNLAALEIAGLSFGFGCSCMSLWMLYISLLGIKFSIPTLLVFVVILLAAAFISYKNFLSRFIHIKKGIRPLRRMTFSKFVLIILIGLSIILGFLEASSLPFTQWDSWGQYGFKAKIFFYEKYCAFKELSNPALNIPNTAYPVSLPLIETYSYIFSGQIYEEAAKVYGFLFFPFLLIVFYALLKRRISSDTAAMAFVFLLSSVPNIVFMSFSGYADIPFVFYSGLGVLYLFESIAKKDDYLFNISFILLSFGAWTKPEGMVIFVLNAALWFFYNQESWQKKAKKIRFIVSCFIIVNMPWLMVKTSYHLTTDNQYRILALRNYSALIGKIKTLVLFFMNTMLDVRKWNLVWLIFGITAILRYKQLLGKKMLFLSAAIVFYGFILSLTYLACINRDFHWLLSNTFDRVVLIFIPWVIFCCAVAYSNEFTCKYHN